MGKKHKNRQHILIAEKVLGKYLPQKSIFTKIKKEGCKS